MMSDSSDISSEGTSDDENYIEKEFSDEDSNKFVNYEHSVKRLRSKNNKKPSINKSEPVTGVSGELPLERDEEKAKAEKLQRLLQILRESQNKISLWQSFHVSNTLHAIVLCYEPHSLIFRVNLSCAAFNQNYQITLKENEIIFMTQSDKSDTRHNKYGLSRLKVCRMYQLPFPIDYEKAVCDQKGNVLNVCVPWCFPLM